MLLRVKVFMVDAVSVKRNELRVLWENKREQNDPTILCKGFMCCISSVDTNKNSHSDSGSI